MGRGTETQRRFSPLLGQSPAVEALRDFIVGVSLLAEPVLLTGGRGAGKSLAARKIHAVGRTSIAPFVLVPVRELSEAELTQLLFSADRGARPAGVLDVRSTSTCHLCGVESLAGEPLELLTRHVLDSRRAERGPRLIFSSELSLPELRSRAYLPAGFLETISTYHMRVPSLRERLEDVPVLCHYQIWLHSAAAEYDERWLTFRSEILPDLLHYDWPGNVTELIEMVQQYCGVEAGSEIPVSAPVHEAPGEFIRRELKRLYRELLFLLRYEQLSGRSQLVLSSDRVQEEPMHHVN